MKINTDLIKNKKFTFPIDATLLKRSQEYRVLATLRHLYPNSFEAMTTGESPDLQDSMNEMGIEVTCAVAENDMRASRAFSQLHQELLLNSQKHLKTILLLKQFICSTYPIQHTSLLTRSRERAELQLL